MIFKVCVRTDRGEEGQPDTNRCGQGARGGSKILYGWPLKTLFFFIQTYVPITQNI